MGPLDIAIAGCGPAGLAAALLLHRDGHRVRLFERFAQPRPIGSGIILQPTGLAVLSDLGLAPAALAAGSRITRLLGRAGLSGPVVLDVRYAALGARAGFGIGMHRAALFDILYSTVEAAGIAIETNRAIVGRSPGPRPRLSFAGGGESPPFDLIVDAMGAGTALAPATGRSLAYGALWASVDWPEDSILNPAALEQRYHRASVMVGVLPIGLAPGSTKPQAAFFWSLRADRLEAWRVAGLPPWKAEVVRLWPSTEPLLAQIADPDRLTFARYAHRTLTTPVEAGLAHIGDAWHSTSPQLGQGANMALLDAYALAKGLRETTDLPAALARYAALRQGHVRLYQTMSRLFTPVYQSDGRVLPFVRDRLVGPVSVLWPATAIQAGMVSGLIGAPLGRLGLASPS